MRSLQIQHFFQVSDSNRFSPEQIPLTLWQGRSMLGEYEGGYIHTHQ